MKICDAVRLCKTYGENTTLAELLLFSYETSSPMFGDVGSAVIDEDGMCYIDIEQMFSETANVDIDYYVFLQKEGSGDIWVEKKEENYFVVRGTPKLNPKDTKYILIILKTMRKRYSYEKSNIIHTLNHGRRR